MTYFVSSDTLNLNSVNQSTSCPSRFFVAFLTAKYIIGSVGTRGLMHLIVEMLKILVLIVCLCTCLSY